WYFGDGNVGYGKYPTHSYDDNGTFQATLEVRDNDLALDIDIINVTLSNAAPVIDPVPPQVAQEDSSFILQITASDVAGDTIIFSVNCSMFEINPSTGLISFTPENQDVGTYIINITAMDEDQDESYMEFELTVENTNDPPFIVSLPITDATEETFYQYQLVVEDDDLLVSPLEMITYSFDSAPQGMQINSSGMISWTPSDSQASHKFNVAINVSDGEESDVQMFEIYVSNINDDPVIISEPVIYAVEDTLYTYDVNASDVDFQDVLTYKLDLAPEGMVINAGSGVISWIPTNDLVGNNEVIVNVTDISGSYDTQEFTILVSNTNDAPELSAIGNLDAYEDQLFYYQVVATDADSNDILSYYDDVDLFDIDRKTGEISFTPSNEDVGTYTVEIMVKDAAGLEDSQLITFTVLNVNDPPILDFIGDWQVAEDLPFSLFVTASDIDSDDSYTFFDNTTLFDIDPNTGEISFTPTNEDVGVHLVNISVVDEDGEVDFQSVFFIIENVNDPPTIIHVNEQYLTVGVPFILTIEASDVDIGDSLTFHDDTDLFEIDSDLGEISFTPKNKDVGMHYINISVEDREGEIDYMTVQFEVIGKKEAKEQDLIWLWLVLALLAAVIIILMVFLTWRRKKTNPEEDMFAFKENIMEPEVPKTQDPPPPPPPP
ncbi:MAG: hypothetical protein JSV09_02245, partial [Thermoplasmata archaeon]